MPTSTRGIRREHVEAYIEDQLIRQRPSTAATRYRDPKQLFGWLVDEGEIPQHPMGRMRPPRLNESSIPLIADSDIRKLLEACSGRSFDDRRDTAIMFVFIDTGARLAEVAGLRVDMDVDFDFDELHVTGKGRRDRALPMGRNIERDARVTVLADHWDEDWTRLAWVMVRAHALIDPDAPPEVVQALSARYGQYAPDERPDALIRMRPTKLIWWTWT
jgi:site-specific recombinase XerC